ncbi:hypothetical protein BGZ90_005957, partial [Linnemannia elongata]
MDRILWLNSQKDVDIELFASYFDHTDEESAVADYLALLSHPRVKAGKRTALLSKLSDWMKHPRDTFWSKQKALVEAQNQINNTQRSLLNAAGDLAPRTISEAALKLSSPKHWDGSQASTQKKAKKSEMDPHPASPASHFSTTPMTPSLRKNSSAIKRAKKMVVGKNDHRILKAREERYARMDRKRFWHLQTGDSVEEILMKFNLTDKATVNTLSFVIDVGCMTTKRLFSNDQWTEILSCRSFELPTVPYETEKYILRLARRLQLHHSMTGLKAPDEDGFSCEIVLDTFRSWARLYSRNTSPFNINQLGEAFWGRRSWPLIMELLDDVDDVFMIDGEKSGLDSTRRRNSGRALNNDGTVKRKRIGKKMDLVARDITSRFDWMIMERQTSFDPQSSKFLQEHGIGLLRETSTIAKNRVQEKDNSDFNARARFFALYGGDRGYQSFEVRPGLSNYVLLMKNHGRFSLPPTMVDIRPIISMKETIKAYREPFHLPNDLDLWSDDDDDEELGRNWSWMYQGDPFIDTGIHIASSPLGS